MTTDTPNAALIEALRDLKHKNLPENAHETRKTHNKAIDEAIEVVRQHKAPEQVEIRNDRVCVGGKWFYAAPVAVEQGYKIVPEYRTVLLAAPIHPTTQAAGGAELIAEFAKEIETIPLGNEIPERGSSEYNWGVYFLRKLKTIASIQQGASHE